MGDPKVFAMVGDEQTKFVLDNLIAVELGEVIEAGIKRLSILLAYCKERNEGKQGNLVNFEIDILTRQIYMGSLFLKKLKDLSDDIGLRWEREHQKAVDEINEEKTRRGNEF